MVEKVGGSDGYGVKWWRRMVVVEDEAWRGVSMEVRGEGGE